MRREKALEVGTALGSGERLPARPPETAIQMKDRETEGLAEQSRQSGLPCARRADDDETHVFSAVFGMIAGEWRCVQECETESERCARLRGKSSIFGVPQKLV
jgi:hypothetical protein